MAEAVMAWIERKEDWIPRRSALKERPREQPLEKSYSVTEVSYLCSVSRGTVFKWLCPDEETGEPVIPAEAWYKLPHSGHIRIREWVIKRLQEGT